MVFAGYSKCSLYLEYSSTTRLSLIVEGSSERAGSALNVPFISFALTSIHSGKPRVYAAQLLLLTPLLAEIGHAAAAFLSVLSWRIAAALDRAFVSKAFLALEEELLPLAAALTALGIQISGHAYSSICAAFSAVGSRCGARVSHPRCC